MCSSFSDDHLVKKAQIQFQNQKSLRLTFNHDRDRIFEPVIMIDWHRWRRTRYYYTQYGNIVNHESNRVGN